MMKALEQRHIRMRTSKETDEGYRGARNEAVDIQARIASDKARMIKLEEQSADLLARKAGEMYEIQAKITIEKKKAADEAMRALGAMSEEDKLKVLSLAVWSKQNKGRKLTPEEQFHMPGEMHSMMSRFFEPHMQSMAIGGSGKWSQNFLGSMFGQKQSTLDAEATLKGESSGWKNPAEYMIKLAKDHLLTAAGFKDSGAFNGGLPRQIAGMNVPAMANIQTPPQIIFMENSIGLKGVGAEITKLFDHALVQHIQYLDRQITHLNDLFLKEKQQIGVASGADIDMPLGH
jgi:hypothetical protein